MFISKPRVYVCAPEGHCTHFAGLSAVRLRKREIQALGLTT